MLKLSYRITAKRWVVICLKWMTETAQSLRLYSMPRTRCATRPCSGMRPLTAAQTSANVHRSYVKSRSLCNIFPQATADVVQMDRKHPKQAIPLVNCRSTVALGSFSMIIRPAVIRLLLDLGGNSFWRLFPIGDISSAFHMTTATAKDKVVDPVT